MISVHFQGKSFNLTVTQVYAPTTEEAAKEDEAEIFYEDLQDFLEHPKKRCPWHHRELESKSSKLRDT